jgi:MFS family permease
VFTAINLLNYLDRFIISPLLPDLKQEMHLSDTQLGALVPAFMLVYMFAAPVFGAWGDRRSRTHAIALGVGLWSVATLLAGFAHNYPHLLAPAPSSGSARRPSWPSPRRCSRTCSRPVTAGGCTRY